MAILRKVCLAAVAVTMMASLSACATGARPEAMTVSSSVMQVAQPGDFGHRGVNVRNVNGGMTTNPLWVSDVSNEDFRVALEQSLRNADYLSEITEGPLVLTVSLLDIKQPMAGLNMTVVSKVRYYIVDLSGAVVFDETVTVSGTARLGEAFAGYERVRLANEHSVRENIRVFIERFQASTKGR